MFKPIFTVLAILVLSSSRASTSHTDVLWPLPSSFSMDSEGGRVVVDPCSITYKVEALPADYVKQMINMYLIEVFKCSSTPQGNITMVVAVRNTSVMVAHKPEEEKYQLTLRTNGHWELVAQYYVGFLRGLETFSQLFQHQPDGKYVVEGLPILVDDVPMFAWRGVMIDTSRHFIPVEVIKHTIDGLLYNKMNILHWHITD